MRRILHEELNFHPYKLAVVQQLNPRDYVARKNAFEAFLENLPQNALVFFSDEAHFHISGYKNKQNMRYWSLTNPRELHEQPLHTERVIGVQYPALSLLAHGSLKRMKEQLC